MAYVVEGIISDEIEVLKTLFFIYIYISGFGFDPTNRPSIVISTPL